MEVVNIEKDSKVKTKGRINKLIRKMCFRLNRKVLDLIYFSEETSFETFLRSRIRFTLG